MGKKIIFFLIFLLAVKDCLGLAVSPPLINLGIVDAGEDVNGSILVINNLDRSAKYKVYIEGYAHIFKLKEKSFSLKPEKRKRANFILTAPMEKGKYAARLIVEEGTDGNLVSAYAIPILFDVQGIDGKKADKDSLSEITGMGIKGLGKPDYDKYAFFILLVIVVALAICVTTRKKRNF